jgi:hypothetical protein
MRLQKKKPFRNVNLEFPKKKPFQKKPGDMSVPVM